MTTTSGSGAGSPRLTDGVITTVAGTGEPGHGGDGGPATEARFNEPRGLALDSSGTLYVAEWNGHRVRAVSPGGVVTTVAGTGVTGAGADGVPALASALDHPIDLAVDAHGRLYVADCFSHRVRVVSPDGLITTAAGTGEPGSDGVRLNQPRGVDLDASGRLLVADSLNERVCVVVSDGTLHTVAGGPPGHEEEGGPAVGARLRLPRALALAPDGSLYVAETDSHRVRVVRGRQ
ncbi:Teneurin-2 [Streptomyces sp. NPDC052309]|uniref:NHL domain-containing protein n=1 Tax=Streptomyces sp. NPDC052309 TaxID=3155421 RepID=UPI0034427683